jgi:Cdc6-like AAA superfamily ATPase
MNTKFALMALTTALMASPLCAWAADRKDAELAMTEAGTAIEGAERADSAQYAPTEVNTAHDMLANAHSAYDHRDWLESVYDSGNAKADANLAAARSREHRAEATTTELETTLRSLREQLGVSGE